MGSHEDEDTVGSLPVDERKMLEILRELIKSGVEPNKLKKIQNA